MTVPAPVPALPDTERRTAYTISNQTGPFAVNFAIYGDGTDYAEWVEVWLNSVQLSPTAFTLTSPSGSVGSLARPITDAVITLAVVSTGSLQIVGARRPRRASQFAENQGVTARDLNQAITDVIAQLREFWDRTRSRMFSVPAGETPNQLPPAAQRANNILAFDSGGNPIMLPLFTGVSQYASLILDNSFTGTQHIAPPFVGNTNKVGLDILHLTGGTPSITSDFNYNKIVVGNDATNASNPAFTTTALYVEFDTGGPNINNEKAAARFIAQMNIAGANTSQDLLGVVAEAISNQNSGGTNTGAGAKGTLYAIGPSAIANAGATNYLVVSGGEFDAFIQPGASAAHRWGISIPGGGSVRGALSDGAVQIGGVGLPWNTGILLSNFNGSAPISTGGSVIGSDGSSVTAQNFVLLTSYTFTGHIFSFQGFEVTGVGNLLANTLGSAVPIVVTGATYTVANIDSAIIANRAGAVTLTLPAAASYPGRWLTLKTITANLVVSAAADVVPQIGGAAGGSILAATAGKWADLQSNGTAWEIMRSG